MICWRSLSGDELDAVVGDKPHFVMVMVIVRSSWPFYLVHGHFTILNIAPMYPSRTDQLVRMITDLLSHLTLLLITVSPYIITIAITYTALGALYLFPLSNQRQYLALSLVFSSLAPLAC